ncbi:glycosyltransferase [Thermodesulfobacteriota bacterium]
MRKKLISIMSNCYNEEDNVEEIYRQIKEVMDQYKSIYTYELIFVDNASTDGTVNKIKNIIEKDKNVRLIVNSRNYGQVRSPYHGLLQTNGDAAISMAADLQDPPSLIKDFIEKWEEGFKNVIGVKIKSKENIIMSLVRNIYYHLIAGISETEQIRNFTGFGLYDRQFINVLRNLNEPYPYFRGLIAELGFSRVEIPYTQPKRRKGKTKNNFYTLYDIAMTGFVNHSKLPLRLAAFIGFVSGSISLMVAIIYFIYKLSYWDRFDVGIAPLVIGLFFFTSVQLFFIGIIGEYIGAIFTQVKNRPLVIEKERINFPSNDQSSENDS